MPRWYDNTIRWLYRSGRPGMFARVTNRLSALAFSAGIWPKRMATLEVRGRRSGQMTSLPVVIADLEGERYLVSMLGEGVYWVRYVRAASGQAILRHGRRELVHLDEVEPDRRAPILKRYLAVAPGARPHIPVDRSAELSDFVRIAPRIPVFHITPAAAGI